MALVYVAMNQINGKFYVGLTSRTLERRSYEHVWQAIHRPGKCPKFHAAIRKYSPEAFSWAILSEHDTFDLAKLAEVQAIGSFRPHYNLTAGGDGTVGHIRSEEYRAKQRVSQSGKKQSAETIERRVLKLRGRKRSAEVIERCAAPNRGRKLTDEHRKKLSISHMGNMHGDEAKAKMSRARLGKKRPAHVLAAMVLGRSVPVICTTYDVAFRTLDDAAKFARVTPGRIAQVCAGDGRLRSGLEFRRLA